MAIVFHGALLVVGGSATGLSVTDGGHGLGGDRLMSDTGHIKASRKFCFLAGTHLKTKRPHRAVDRAGLDLMGDFGDSFMHQSGRQMHSQNGIENHFAGNPELART